MGHNVFDCLVLMKALLNKINLIKRGEKEGGRKAFIDHSELQDTHSAAGLLGTEISYLNSLATLAGFYHHSTES